MINSILWHMSSFMKKPQTCQIASIASLEEIPLPHISSHFRQSILPTPIPPISPSISRTKIGITCLVHLSRWIWTTFILMYRPPYGERKHKEDVPKIVFPLYNTCHDENYSQRLCIEDFWGLIICLFIIDISPFLIIRYGLYIEIIFFPFLPWIFSSFSYCIWMNHQFVSENDVWITKCAIQEERKKSERWMRTL